MEIVGNSGVGAFCEIGGQGGFIDLSIYSTIHYPLDMIQKVHHQLPLLFSLLLPLL